MARYLKTTDIDWYRKRLTGVVFCVIAAFAVLIIRLFYLQVLEGEKYRGDSENQKVRKQVVDASRGLIFDRNGKLMVDNRPSFDLGIVLKDAKPLDEVLEKLSGYTGIGIEEITSRIPRKKGQSRFKPILLKQDIGRNMLAAVEVHKFDLPGIVIDIKPRRYYIYKRSAAHLLGHMGEINLAEIRSGKYPECRPGDYIGKFGVEKVSDADLTGKRGGRLVEVDARGRVVQNLKTVDALPGRNIYLTIDLELQKKTEELMGKHVGAIAAMNADTGHILAMVSCPSFDPNSFVSGISSAEWKALISNPFRPMGNKVTTGQYPPASTYKIVTAIAGLEEGVIDKDTSFFCPGYLKFGDRNFRCWKKAGHGNVNVRKAVAESCDVFFYHVGQKLGVDRLASYAKRCGLGSRTGINLDRESTGLIPTAAWKLKRKKVPWQRGETLPIAIGQGFNLVTPLQMLVLVSAVGNGGTLYRPAIIKKIETADGETVFVDKRNVMGRLPCTKKTLGLVRGGMWEVVNGKGTARIARIEGIEVCGKTGTAQIISRKKNEVGWKMDRAAHLRAHAWFVAYAPTDRGTIAVAVIVEHGEHGSSTAAPIAREVIKCFAGK